MKHVQSFNYQREVLYHRGYFFLLRKILMNFLFPRGMLIKRLFFFNTFFLSFTVVEMEQVDLLSFTLMCVCVQDHIVIRQ